jgi:uncharacterized protein (DUF433 family)
MFAQPVQTPEIAADPRICGGEPCIAGTRIPVRVIHQYRQWGFESEKIRERYPFLSIGQITAALQFADQHLTEIERLISEIEMD